MSIRTKIVKIIREAKSGSSIMATQYADEIIALIKKEILEKLPTPEQLHIWYLEATKELHPLNFNEKAQKPYNELNPEQKFIDEYIANKIGKVVEEA